ncbi:MAG: hypothetical protein IPP19_13745 [Verrucomicrobia bacterium]|nr:hypothetical protein [Verrucomicrobiota bacterium]
MRTLRAGHGRGRSVTLGKEQMSAQNLTAPGAFTVLACLFFFLPAVFLILQLRLPKEKRLYWGRNPPGPVCSPLSLIALAACALFCGSCLVLSDIGYAINGPVFLGIFFGLFSLIIGFGFLDHRHAKRKTGA